MINYIHNLGVRLCVNVYFPLVFFIIQLKMVAICELLFLHTIDSEIFRNKDKYNHEKTHIRNEENREKISE